MRPLPESADVVIVGGGTAGCVLAARLSEHGARSVLLLESGPAYSSRALCPPEILDPTALPVGPGSRWATHYPVELGPGRSAQAVRGRVLGGSGAVNGCSFARGLPENYDAWQSELWTYRSVLPYFRALETDHDFGGEFHGDAGPIPVRRDVGNRLSQFSAEFMSACLAAGFPEDPDKNAPTSRGIGPVPCNVENGTRISTALAYLIPVLERSNLTVLGKTTMRRLVFDGRTVIGVDVERGAEQTHRVHAGRVVLCAGAIESAAILMRSGIGDADQLRKLGIDVVQTLSGVGSGFSDHPEVSVSYRPASLDRVAPAPALQVTLNYDDIEIRPYTAQFGQLVPGSGGGLPQLGVASMRPRARGEVRLRSGDPRTSPAIRYHYLECLDDRLSMRRGLETARDLLALLTGAGVVASFEIETNDAWIAHRLGTSQHMLGTCRMGSADDERAVVSERCEVHGIAGLAVVDLSIVPAPITRGVHATAVMVAERAADLFSVHTSFDGGDEQVFDPVEP